MTESKEMMLTPDDVRGLDGAGEVIVGGVGTRITFPAGAWLIGKFLGEVSIDAPWTDQAGVKHDHLDLLRFAVVQSEGVTNAEHTLPVDIGEVVTIPSSGLLKWAFSVEKKVQTGRFVKIKYKGKKKGTNSQGVACMMNDWSILDITDALRARGLE